MQGNSLDRMAETYREMLLADDAAVFYLRGRGIDPLADTCLPGSDESVTVAERYGLGLVAGPVTPGHAGFSGRLSIAYRTPAGVKGFKFRALDDSEPKYLAPLGQKPRLFNVLDLHEDPALVAVCEGELDAVVCSSVVGVPAVGVAGTAMWKPHLPRVFAGIPRVIVIADNDEKQDGRNPGRELAERVARDVEQAEVISPPKGLDLTEWVLRDGVDAVKKGLGL